METLKFRAHNIELDCEYLYNWCKSKILCIFVLTAKSYSVKYSKLTHSQ